MGHFARECNAARNGTYLVMETLSEADTADTILGLAADRRTRIVTRRARGGIAVTAANVGEASRRSPRRVDDRLK